MFGLFNKKKGCLYGKTEEEKISFFKSLSGFAISDKQFFREQWADLLPHEQKEFHNWVIKDAEEKKAMKKLVDFLEILLKEKYGK